MNPGRLNKRVTFQKRVREKVAGGSVNDTFENAFTVWGNFRVLAPQHRQFLGQSATFEPNRIIIRKDSKRMPSPKMRAIMEGNAYNVLTVREYTPDSKYLEIEAVEILP